MHCLNCKKSINSGVLWSRDSKNTFVVHGVEQHKPKRFFVFCDVKCQDEFMLNEMWFNKQTTPLRKRLVSWQEVLDQLQRARLSHDDEDFKDLMDVLVDSIHTSFRG